MSRFFARSDSESESSSSEEEVQQKPVAKAFIPVSDDDEETKRVVRSNKDKRFEEIQNIIKTMKNHKKIKDMSNVLQDFEELGRAYDKAKKIVDKEGIPTFYVRCLAELETFVNEHWEDTEGRKAMSKNNSKGLAALRQKLKKYNKNFETNIENYRKNPEVGESDEEDEEKDEDDEENSEAEDHEVPVQKEVSSKFLKKDEESESDDEMWEGSSSSESSSSDDEIRPLGQLTADYFRKKAPTEADEAKKAKKEEKEKRRKIRPKQEEDSENEGEWEQVKGGVAVPVVEKPEIFAKDTEINHEVVLKKLNELVANRGKKGTDRSIQIELLIELRTIAKANNLGDALDCKILFCIIAAIYDYNPNIATNMRPEMWEKCIVYIKELLAILNRNVDTIIVGEYITEDSETFTGNPPFRLRGCMLTIVERMDEEFTKMLQSCDAHSTEYIDRLKDETTICQIIENLEKYLKGHATDDDLCRVFLRRIQHLYYKFEPKSQGSGVNTEASDPSNSRTLMDTLCKFIYTKDTTDRNRTRAILSHIYFHALHDRYFEARDLMLMSHLQDNIQHSDIPTQILYNRAMVQLGICAFRQGMIKDAHSCLVDIQSSGRAKELLTQGLLQQRQQERTPEQEKIEKRRQMPYHMHINLELLECVYLVSAMLIEIPFMAAHEFDARRRISKNLHHVLRFSERQALVGPPESMREHVVAACKAMKFGDWKACKNFIVNEKMNAKVWDLFYNADGVRKMIIQKIQEESLRTYLFSYSSIYDSLSLEILSEMFELDMAMVHSVISKMIINEELMASLDEPTQTVIMHRTEPTHIQSLALQLSEKLSQIVEQNERLLDMKTTGPSYFNYQQRGGQQQGGYQQRGDRDQHRDQQQQQQQNYGGRRQNQRGQRNY